MEPLGVTGNDAPAYSRQTDNFINLCSKKRSFWIICLRDLHIHDTFMTHSRHNHDNSQTLGRLWNDCGSHNRGLNRHTHTQNQQSDILGSLQEPKMLTWQIDDWYLFDYQVHKSILITNMVKTVLLSILHKPCLKFYQFLKASVSTMMLLQGLLLIFFLHDIMGQETVSINKCCPEGEIFKSSEKVCVKASSSRTRDETYDFLI